MKCLVAIFAIMTIAYLARHLLTVLRGEQHLFGDFFAFWSYAKFLLARPPDQIYDVTTLLAFEQTIPGGNPNEYYPCIYPPTALFLILPLGWLPYLPAALLWLGSTLIGYLVAVAGRDWRSPGFWLALLAPSTMLTIVAGQNGFLTAALLIGGFRLIGRKPLLGGFILGLLTFKPQFFVLVPVALLAMRNWRAIIGLAVSVLALVAASCVAFGPIIWLRWLQAGPAIWPMLQANWASLKHLEPTVTEALLTAGLDVGTAQALQLAAALGAVACIWVLFRPGAKLQTTPRPLSVAALQVTAFFATPYAFVYDLPMVTSAAATTIDCATQAGRPWRPGETTVLALALLLPVILFSGLFDGWAVGPITMALLVALILRIEASLNR